LADQRAITDGLTNRDGQRAQAIEALVKAVDSFKQMIERFNQTIAEFSAANAEQQELLKLAILNNDDGVKAASDLLRKVFRSKIAKAGGFLTAACAFFVATTGFIAALLKIWELMHGRIPVP